MADRPEEPQDPHPRRSGDPDLPSGEQVTDAVASEILKMYEEAYGRGASTASAALVGDFVVVVLDDVDLMPNEELLVRSGRADAVTQVRRVYQDAIQDTFSAAVERATGRRVIGFESTTSVGEERFMVEVFKLE